MTFDLDDLKSQLSAALKKLQASAESVRDQVSERTGLDDDQTTAAAVALVLGLVLLLLLFPRKRKPSPPPANAPVTAPRKREIGDVTLEELSTYNGVDPSKPICVAIKGVVYDVSRARHLYGPEGGYGGFAGKDASRALAKMSMDPADAVGDLTGLTQSELDSLSEWEVQYQFKYDAIGKIKGPPAPAPSAAAED